MTRPQRTPDAPASDQRSRRTRDWLAHRPDRLAVANGLRIVLVVVALLLLVFGVLAIFRPETPELGGTALVISGVALIVLALLGRLPNRLVAGGVEVEFDADTVEKVLTLLKTDAPPEVYDAARAIVEQEARGDRADVGRMVRDAEKTAARESDANRRFESEVSGEGSSQTVAAPQGEATAAATLERLFPDWTAGDGGRGITVRVPTRGQPPLIDGEFSYRDRRVAVEITSSWSPTTARIVPQRLLRVLTNPEYAAAVVIVPRELVADARTDLDDDRIVVVGSGELAQLPDHLARVIPEA